MKNLIAFIVLLVAGVTAYFLFIRDQKPQLSTADFRDFAIEDTASVDKIFMSQKDGQNITISRRESGKWIVNNDFPASVHPINLILKTFHDVQVRGGVSKESYNYVIKRLATSGIKVEIYMGGDKPEKIWYVGDPTSDNLGTYMLLEKDEVKSSKPYMMHLLMERGYLTSRFFLDPVLWKDRALMKINPQNIRRVEVKHANDTATSFAIEQLGAENFLLTNLRTSESEAISNGIAIPYFKKLGKVYYEYEDVKTEQSVLDSIYSALPRHEVNLLMKNGENIQLKTYNMPVAPGSTLEGIAIDYHPERMYAFSSKLGTDVYPVVQNFSFDAVVPSLEMLKSSTTVEK